MEQSLKNRLVRIQSRFQKELKNSISFWIDYGYDEAYGGFCTYLDCKGTRYAFEKPMWAQGRGLWMISSLYQYNPQVYPYLEHAKKTFEFIRDHGFDRDGRMHFLVTQDGKSIQKRRYAFSEAFAAIGCLQYYVISQDASSYDLAIKTYHIFSSYCHGTLTTLPKYNPDVVSFQSLSEPMILLKTAQIFQMLDPLNKLKYQEDQIFATKRIIQHIARDHDAVFEFIPNAPTTVFLPKQRLMNPGHAIEASWFLIDAYLMNDRKDSLLLANAKWIFDTMVHRGWDPIYGGLFSFLDSSNLPLEALEWDMKLWWPQTEMMLAALKLFQTTCDSQYLDQFEKVESYFFQHFQIDNQEFLGYLHRNNHPSHLLKGNLFKGPFHIPRMFLEGLQTIESILKDYQYDKTTT